MKRIFKKNKRLTQNNGPKQEKLRGQPLNVETKEKLRGQPRKITGSEITGSALEC